MTSAGPRKFTFDTAFDGGRVVRDASKTKKFFLPEEVEAAKAEAYEAGRASVEARAAQAQSMALGDIARAVLAALDEMDAIGREARARAAEIALAAARKIAGASLRMHPVEAVEETIAACLSQIPHEPRVVVRVDVDLAAELKDRIARLAEEIGFDGRIVVAGEHALTAADCRLEWADGGASRDAAAIAAAVDEAVARFVENDRRLAAQARAREAHEGTP